MNTYGVIIAGDKKAIFILNSYVSNPVFLTLKIYWPFPVEAARQRRGAAAAHRGSGGTAPRRLPAGHYLG